MKSTEYLIVYPLNLHQRPSSTLAQPRFQNPGPPAKKGILVPNSPSQKSFSADSPALADYVFKLFKPEDDILAGTRVRAQQAGLPAIHVSPFDGLHLEVLARAAGAKKIVEIGTLAGLSGTCLARGLSPGGHLHTFEYEPRHAQVAAETFRLARVDHFVTIHVGAALTNLPKIESHAPFDLVFIDADKENYPNYLAWAAKHLRPGGIVLADNAFAWGLLTEPSDSARLKEPSQRAARDAIHAVNSRLADPNGPFRSTMLPTGEGLAMGVRR